MNVLKYVVLFFCLFYSVHSLYISNNYNTFIFFEHAALFLISMLFLKFQELIFLTEKQAAFFYEIKGKRSSKWIDILLLSSSIFLYTESIDALIKNQLWILIVILLNITVYLFFSHLHLKKSLISNNYVHYKTKVSYESILYHEMAHASILKYFDADYFNDYTLKVALPEKGLLGKLINFLDPLPYGGSLNFEFKNSEQEKDKKISYFFMLMFLAGNTGERILTGKEAPGSNSDMIRWKEEAEFYLKNWYASLYNNHPKDKIQIEENLISLEKLKDEQVVKLEEYFTKNKDVFVKYFNLFKDKRLINKIELNGFLKELKNI